jgi:hypothetical protein
MHKLSGPSLVLSQQFAVAPACTVQKSFPPRSAGSPTQPQSVFKREWERRMYGAYTSVYARLPARHDVNLVTRCTVMFAEARRAGYWGSFLTVKDTKVLHQF